MARIKKKFISEAIKEPGSFTRQAVAADKSVSAFATQVLRPGSKATSTTKRRAVLAQTLAKIAGKRKR